MTNQWDLFNQPCAVIPFTLRDRPGKVAVYYGANTDHMLAGFDFLTGINFDLRLCRGYPLVHARIEEYTGSGYRTVCAWMQVVTRVDAAAHDPAAARVRSQSIDVAPAFQELDLPFTCFGNLPQFFDAPASNLNGSAELTWTADTFLTTTPLRSRNDPIERLAGFRWGYSETDTPGSLPVLQPLEVTGTQVWNDLLPFLRGRFTGWSFIGT
jgi:hypothetical protein